MHIQHVDQDDEKGPSPSSPISSHRQSFPSPQDHQDSNPPASAATPDETEQQQSTRECNYELHARGYTTMAQAMAYLPENAILRRFTALSMESLLHYQAELTELENALRRQQRLDRDSGDDVRRDYALDSWTLRTPLGRNQTGDQPAQPTGSLQWELLKKIRSTLRDYNEALELHRRMAAFPEPHARNLQELDEWMQDPGRGRVYLIGEDRHTWRDTPLPELLTLLPLSPDRLANDFSQNVMYYYHKYLGRKIHKPEHVKRGGVDPERAQNAGSRGEDAEDDLWQNTIVYPNKTIMRITRTAQTLVACLLPIVAIIILHEVESVDGRLGAIAALTALFALTLNMCTSVGIKDIFGASAAFSAVLVVFVGTNN